MNDQIICILEAIIKANKLNELDFVSAIVVQQLVNIADDPITTANYLKQAIDDTLSAMGE